MKKVSAILLLVSCICVLISGCGSWPNGSYASVKPHNPDSYRQEQTATVARSYIQLRQMLVAMVENGTQSGIIAVDGFDSDTVSTFMQRAVKHVSTENPIGAYALSEITYELGTNAGMMAVSVDIRYVHGRSEILRIKHVPNMDEAMALIYSNLDNCTEGVVMLVEEYTQKDMRQLTEDYAETNPQSVMEMPLVSAAVFPESGRRRIIEISFTYQNSREDLRIMQEKVRPMFTAAQIYVRNTADTREKYSQLYSFLMERFENYVVNTSITPTYSVLMYGEGDSEAFANVYAAMCVEAGLECEVVTGTKQAEAWYWNVIRYDGAVYHVDLLECLQLGSFQEMQAETMTQYVWDYSAYEGVAPAT